MNLFLLFIALSVLNVILQTIKSIVTVKSGAFAAALVNAITYFVYTYVLIYTNCELPMLTKAITTALANFLGVYIVKILEKRMKKDKLWRVEATVEQNQQATIEMLLENAKLPFNTFVTNDNRVVFAIYCPTQANSREAKSILDTHGAKYFVTEQNCVL